MRCSHWLCATGGIRGCYFHVDVRDVGSVPAGAPKVTEETWDDLDGKFEALRARGENHVVAHVIGSAIQEALRWEMLANRATPERGEQVRQKMEARYGAAATPDPQGALPPRRVIIRATHSAAEAAAEIRKLGEPFAAAVGERLRE